MRHAGSLYLILIGLMLCAAGGAFTWLMWRSFDRAASQRGWQELPCRILKAGIADEHRLSAEEPAEYRFEVLYGYEVDGVGYTSDRYSLRGGGWSHGKQKAQAQVDAFPAGSEQVCFVDPADPSSAVLKRDSKGPGYSLWFPMLFVLGGLGIIGGAVRSIMKGRPRGSAPGQRS